MRPLLFLTHPRFLDHDPGRGHPECPARLVAVSKGMEDAGLGEAVTPVAPRPATSEEMTRVHPAAFVDTMEQFCAAGGGSIDADTGAAPESFEAALLAAGAGLEAVDRLGRGEADAAFCAVRPPGHHATPTRSMGFCLFNNVAVTAAALAERGERVLIVDYDAHHGNGTQAAFYSDPRVTYVSIHEYPLYPGTGALHETGQGAGEGRTVNIPVPRGATGDVYRRAVEEVITPLAERWEPTWLILSAGFDAHRRDPLTGLSLTAADYGEMTADLARLVPAGRRLVFLEGGYDMSALAHSTGATLTALVSGAPAREHPEPATSGGPGMDVIDAVIDIRRHADTAAS